MKMAPLRIAIIGAGPAGLTLARLLRVSEQAQYLHVAVFEKDASPTTRAQQVGGTLDLHDDTGLAALRAAGLWDQSEKYFRYDGEALAITDKNGSRLVDVKSNESAAKAKGNRPEIDRQALMTVLLHSIPAETIKWAHKLAYVSASKTLVFPDSKDKEEPFDLIIGADGASSKMRSILTDIKPHYAGISGFELRMDTPDQNYADTSHEIGSGSVFAYGDLKSLVAQRMGDGSIKVVVWGVLPEDYCQNIMARHSKKQVHQILMNRYADWATSLRRCISQCDTESLKAWPLYELPVGLRWDHVTGYTLMGDAAHLMTPFAGEGVNAALRDALELSRAIVKGFELGDLDLQIKSYEKEMFQRAAKVTAETHRNKTLMFRQDAPLGFVVGMTKAIGEEKKDTGVLARLLVWPSVQNVIQSYFSGILAFGAWRRRLRYVFHTAVRRHLKSGV